KLQTALFAGELQDRLLAIYYAARTALEEQGVNTLFLALGMLAWSEPDAPTAILRAPLILVPVALERSSARERFRLRHDGEDPDVNLSLAEKLRAEFGIDLPGLPEEEELDVGRHLDAVAAAVRGQEGWAVERDAAALGFFSFTKFLMYRDLDPESWPEGAGPGAHPILNALLAEGFREPEAGPGLDEDELLDRRPEAADLRLVVDADGTQTLALLDARAGRDLVIQGPPGTGKSQTITNLIADAVGRGQTVLFVAEKMAALEVVKRRLDGVGLGAACLELHSQKVSKKALHEQLRWALGLGRPRPGAAEDDRTRRDELRDALNAYCEAVNTPIGASGLTPHQAIGELLRIGLSTAENAENAEPKAETTGENDGETEDERKRDNEARIAGSDPSKSNSLRSSSVFSSAFSAFSAVQTSDLPEWTAAEYRRRLALVERLQARVAALGPLRAHPYWGSRRATLLPGDEELLRQRLRVARHAAAALREATAALARFLRLPPATTRVAGEVLLRSAQRAAESVAWQGAQIRGEWLSRREDLRELLEAGTALAERRRRYDATLLPEAWELDLRETRQALNAHGRPWWRHLHVPYRRALFRLAAACRAVPPARLDEQLALLDAVREARDLREVVRRHEPLAARLFGRRWRGEASDWPALADLADWMERLHLDIREGRLPRGLLDLLADAPALHGLETLVRAVEAARGAHAEALGRLLAFLEFDEPARFGGEGGLADLPFVDLEALLDAWTRATRKLEPLVALNRLAARCRAEGLADVVTLAEAWPEAGHLLGAAFRRQWLEGLLRRALRERPVLAEFDGEVQDGSIRAFAELDRRALVHDRAHLALALWQTLPRHDGGGQLAVLRRELAKRARHLPVRQLMARAGRAVQAITPVFLMSPLSVAAHLPPGALAFDLVVFDEASQVKPVDALGALVRGRQAVVVGDSRQLPPTRFFDRLTGGDDRDDDDEATADVESILGLFVAQGAPQRMLRWHYRSRHESLIAVSNRQFYDDRLVVFPSPDAGRRAAGLIFHHLPETAYDRGRTRTNPGEAEAVARAVLEHARAQAGRPHGRRLTLGVATFSTAQRQAIVDRLERLRRAEPACEAFFDEGAEEPVFVKNLENVQGDERDVIFISIGYGRTATGELALNFGPLNAEGGERRLNVLITRARVRCEVFTNLTAGDIDPGRSRSRGVGALRSFLAYAQTGRLDGPDPAATEPASPFEEAVRAALTASGWGVRTRVGSAGSALDLAVVDPDRPGQYLLGLECDGPSYREARSARDRDRLRRQVLEGLGWRLLRLWSPAWLRDPEGQRARVRAALEAARTEATADGAEAAIRGREARVGTGDDPKIERAEGGDPGPRPADIPAYRPADLAAELGGVDLTAVPTDRLAGWVAEVVRIEGPVHVAEVTRRLAEAAGAKRLGPRIQEAVEMAGSHARALGMIRREGEFLWPAGTMSLVVRDRGGLPAASRRLELVAPEEIALAVERVVRDGFGMEPGSIPASACRLLGFPRLSDEMRRRVESVVAGLLQQGRLVQQGDHLVLPALLGVG
ncbi:MAG TPA: DUF3320 domain-containing protein, partial [Isosphaeraceae bacterium]